jgi:apolipoprotein D and lipocalin family protein
VSRQAYGALLDRLERQGFDLSRLERTIQAE